jgi:hypothetical protein
VFQPGEQIIVDTPIGMWPGIVSCTLHLQVNLLLIYDFKFESYVEGHPGMIRFSLFPRETSQEILIEHENNIIPFPLDHIEVLFNNPNSKILKHFYRHRLTKATALKCWKRYAMLWPMHESVLHRMLGV